MNEPTTIRCSIVITCKLFVRFLDVFNRSGFIDAEHLVVVNLLAHWTESNTQKERQKTSVWGQCKQKLWWRHTSRCVKHAKEMLAKGEEQIYWDPHEFSLVKKKIHQSKHFWSHTNGQVQMTTLIRCTRVHVTPFNCQTHSPSSWCPCSSSITGHYW